MCRVDWDPTRSPKNTRRFRTGPDGSSAWQSCDRGHPGGNFWDVGAVTKTHSGFEQNRRVKKGFRSGPLWRSIVARETRTETVSTRWGPGLVAENVFRRSIDYGARKERPRSGQHPSRVDSKRSGAERVGRGLVATQPTSGPNRFWRWKKVLPLKPSGSALLSVRF